ncbi:MAG: hypothetical protein CVU44_22925 [Chloroflexi bacterium HGW-Chloroflexi-6]|nr:MAG: hypothetical protein CVU44_22925 [Chloroflexi bacterium HGW-Chloroflexi-6]
MTINREQLVQELETNLPHFTGTESYTNLRYPWLRSRFLLTDGTKYLAETANAFWLMDSIASHQTNHKVAAEPFQVWKLAVDEKRQAVLTCADGNETVLVHQEIPYTDFPLSEIALYAEQSDYLDGRVVMLTSEY